MRLRAYLGRGKPRPYKNTVKARAAKACSFFGFKRRLNADLTDLRRFTRILSA
ncbi:MAG: hypothetical protein FWG87_00055 [Defluviitaleaceae bacterium]|nr:hypothetical protein [Defluviitaleaceae bacterium]